MKKTIERFCRSMTSALAVACFVCCSDETKVTVSGPTSIENTPYAYSISATSLKPGETLQVEFTTTATHPKGLVLQFLDEKIFISEFPFTYRKTVRETGTFPLSVYSKFRIEGENIIISGESETTIQINVTK